MNNTDIQITVLQYCITILTLYYNTVNLSLVLTLTIYRPSTAVLEVSNADPEEILK